MEAFNLTNGGQQGPEFKRPYAYISEDEGDAVSDSDDDFEIDNTALKGILNNTGIKVQDWYSVSWLQEARLCNLEKEMILINTGVDVQRIMPGRLSCLQRFRKVLFWQITELNLSITATLGTEEISRCREVKQKSMFGLSTKRVIVIEGSTVIHL